MRGGEKNVVVKKVFSVVVDYTLVNLENYSD